MSILKKKIPLPRVLAYVSAGFFLLGGCLTAAFAGDAQSIGDLATNVTGSLGAVETLAVAISYIGGVAFAIAAIMKFKQYKDNPQQITLGQPVALVFIAAALIWLPQIIKTSGQTVFGTTEDAGSASGTTIFE